MGNRFGTYVAAALLLVATGASARAACQEDVIWLRGEFGQARFAVAVADAVAHVDEIEVGVDLQDVDGRLVVEGTDARDVDAVVPAQGDWEGARFEGGPDAGFDIGV